MSGDMFGRVVLAVLALAFAVVAWTAFTAPHALLDPVGLTIDGNSGLSETKAAYGGMHVGLALIFLVGALMDGFRNGALWTALAVTGGLTGGRLVSLVADGIPNPFVWVLLAVEAAGAVAAGLGLVRRTT